MPAGARGVSNNCFELLELGKNWKERPRTFIQLKAFNYVPVGTKEKELVKLLREKPLELTNAVMRKFKVQIESFLSLGIVEKWLCLLPATR